MTDTRTRHRPTRKVPGSAFPAPAQPNPVRGAHSYTLDEDEPAAPEDENKALYNDLLAAMPPDEPVYVAGNRAPRLKVGRYTLQPGEIVPGAHHWPRREAYERLGRIERR